MRPIDDNVLDGGADAGAGRDPSGRRSRPARDRLIWSRSGQRQLAAEFSLQLSPRSERKQRAARIAARSLDAVLEAG
jgi:hypothetical protein